MASIVEALADCLETMRRGAGLEAALEQYPEHRLQLKALLEVATLIRPLPEDVVPSHAFRAVVKSHILAAGGVPPWYRPGEDPRGTYPH